MKVFPRVCALIVLCAVLSAGCRIVSGQFFANHRLPNPLTIRSTGFDVYPIDLNSIRDYQRHKHHIKKLDDVALVGRFKNLGGQAGAMEVWVTADDTRLPDAAAVRAQAVKLWGQYSLPAGVGVTRQIGWDESARLFTPAGKSLVLREAKNDGRFTVYVLGTAGTYQIEARDAALIMILSAAR